MSRAIAVLRPQPGNAATAAEIERRGHTAIRLPLFEVRPLAWQAPDPARFDALLLTSANALRHGGAGLAQLANLPVYAVGEATAQAARGVGLPVAGVGERDAASLVEMAEAAGVRRALHLAGRERTLGEGGIVAQVIAVYSSEPIEADARLLAEAVVLVQSARAGARLAALVDQMCVPRSGIALVAVSARAAAAAGPGWRDIRVASQGNAGLIDAAIALAD